MVKINNEEESKNMENNKKTPQKKRNIKNFDKKKFEKLCALQCTAVEIASEMGISRVTLNTRIKENYDNRTFKEVFEEKRAKGFVSLRKAQFKMAMENVKMNIFLSKNYLGMSDIVVNNNEEEVTKFENMILNLKHALQNNTVNEDVEND